MRRTGSVFIFAAISLALHLAWVAFLPAGKPPAPPDAPWVEVSFQDPQPPAAPSPAASSIAAASIDTEAAPVAATAATEAPKLPTRSGPERSTSLRAARAEPPPVAAAESEHPQPSPMLQLGAAEPAPAATTHAQPARLPQLSPRAAALSVEAFTRGPALRCAAPGTSGPDIGASECAPTDKLKAAQAALSRDLESIAKNVPHLRAREAPDLRRRSDGSYAYDGHVFQALLRPDGQVEFNDAATDAQLSLSLTPFKVVADLNDLAERHVLGRELYSAEKNWFLEQTRELRTQLASEARRRELLAANRALERTLQELLGDHTLSAAQRHDAVFLIWQDCGEDAQQKAHRRAVEAFVRRYMPRDSEQGFSADELEQLNTSRTGLQRFEPYADSRG